PDYVTQSPKHGGADRAHHKTQSEHRECRQQRRCIVARRKERFRKNPGYKGINTKVIPFERIAKGRCGDRFESCLEYACHGSRLGSGARNSRTWSATVRIGQSGYRRSISEKTRPHVCSLWAGAFWIWAGKCQGSEL